jgi:hypothetical protein
VADVIGSRFHETEEQPELHNHQENGKHDSRQSDRKADFVVQKVAPR